MNFYKITIGKRLAIGFSLITIITLFVGMFAITELKKSLDITNDMFKHSYSVSNSVKDIHSAIMSIDSALLSMIINNNKSFVDKQIIKIIIDDKDIHKHFSIILER